MVGLMFSLSLPLSLFSRVSEILEQVGCVEFRHLSLGGVFLRPSALPFHCESSLHSPRLNDRHTLSKAMGGVYMCVCRVELLSKDNPETRTLFLSSRTVVAMYYAEPLN